ncbi:MAG: cell envelope integrity protein CreD [Verrucomicrobiales bacterium]|nr:cell envelope integrity protein CreD [Verrucomicrobiales bacterium]
MSNNWIIPAMESIRSSLFLRTLLIGFLILIMQIPVVMINGVIRERESTRDAAFQDVTKSWGGRQSIVGPWISVPYKHHSVQRKSSNNKVEHFTTTQTKVATFLPMDLQIDGEVVNDLRKRGIFKVPLYKAELSFSGHFSKPDFSSWGVSDDDILWDRAYLSVGLTDSRGIVKQSELTWLDSKIDFLPGTGILNSTAPGIHAPLKGLSSESDFEFSFPLNINGSDTLLFTPYGNDTRVNLKSDWIDPSFQGNWLPVNHDIDEEGFQASWSIPYLGRNYPQSWKDARNLSSSIQASEFGVRFIVPVDNYRMGFRSVKYAPLFLMLTFITLWLFEIISHSRIHPLQYLLLGAGMCVFYLLELSLAEHIGFGWSYVIASTLVVGLMGSYSFVFLKSIFKASFVGTIAALLYGYLYVLLRSQDYALLIGSFGLFFTIATVMYLTRKINWYNSSSSEIKKSPLSPPPLQNNAQ